MWSFLPVFVVYHQGWGINFAIGRPSVDSWKHVDTFPEGDVVWRRVPRDGYWEYIVDMKSSTYLQGEHEIKPIEETDAEREEKDNDR